MQAESGPGDPIGEPDDSSGPRDVIRGALLAPETLVRAIGSGRRRGADAAAVPAGRAAVRRPQGGPAPADHRVRRAAGAHPERGGGDGRGRVGRRAARPRRTGTGTSRRPARRCGCGTPRRASRCCTGRPRAASRRPTTTGSSSGLLDPAAPFLVELGISDHHGRVKPSRQSKYKQIDEFCKLLAPARRRGASRPAGSRPTGRCRWSTWAAATRTSRSRRTTC